MGFSAALNAGMSAINILNQLSKVFPDLGSQIKKASEAGYTPDQILAFVSKMEKQIPKYYKPGKSSEAIIPFQENENPQQQFSQENDNPGISYRENLRNPKNRSSIDRFLGQLGNVLVDTGVGFGGAALGSALGGPVGGAAGAVSAPVILRDVVKRYEDYTKEGGDGSFGEFLSGAVKSLGKGGVAGAGAAGVMALVKQLPQLLQNPQFSEFFNKKPQSTQNEQKQTSQQQAPQTSATPESKNIQFRTIDDRDNPLIEENISPEIAENVQKTTEKPELEPEDTTGLKAMGSGMADAMSHNLYKGLFESLKQGKTKFAGIEDPLLAKAKPLFEKGLIKNQEDLRKFANGQLSLNSEKQKNLIRPSTPGPQEAKELKKDAASAVVRRMVYNPDDETLKVIFNNNAAYNYYDVPQDSWQKLSQGQASAKTDGQNEFGVWWSGKNPSVGAALNEYIKKPEFIYEKVDDDFVSQEDLDSVIQEIKAKVQEYKAAPKDGRKDLFDEINRLRQVENNLRKALKKKTSN